MELNDKNMRGWSNGFIKWVLKQYNERLTKQYETIRQNLDEYLATHKADT